MMHLIHRKAYCGMGNEEIKKKIFRMASSRNIFEFPNVFQEETYTPSITVHSLPPPPPVHRFMTVLNHLIKFYCPRFPMGLHVVSFFGSNLLSVRFYYCRDLDVFPFYRRPNIGSTFATRTTTTTTIDSHNCNFTPEAAISWPLLAIISVLPVKMMYLETRLGRSRYIS